MAIMPIVTVQVSEQKLREVTERLGGASRQVSRAIYRSVGRVATRARSRIVKAISAEVNIKQKDIRENITKNGPHSYQDMTSVISITGKRIKLTKFGANKNSKGVTYRISKKGGRSFIKSAFKAVVVGAISREAFKWGNKGRAIAAVLAGESISTHEGVFRRRGKERHPLDEMHGPSVTGVYQHAPNLAATIVADTNMELEKEIDSQVALLISKMNGGIASA